MSPNDQDDGIDRRSVLRGLAATGTAAIGVTAASGSAAAEVYRTKRKLEDPEAARATFARRTSEVRRELADRGIVESDSVDEFSFEPRLEPEAVVSETADFEGYDVAADTEHDTAHLSVSKNTGRYQLAVYVRPGEERAYAVVEDTRNDERFAIVPDAESVRLESASYCLENYCAGCCEYNDGYRREFHRDCFYEPQFGCVCETTSTDCTGCSGMDCDVVDWT